MAQIFPEWANNVPKQIQLGLIISLTGIVFGFWYFGSPEYLEVGYAPQQPIPYSHQLHVGQLGIDCRYCHASVEISPKASIPPTQTCMGCHEQILPDSPALEPLWESWETGNPVEWVRVHDVPDHAYFDHSAHINVGIGCTSCHGRVDRMHVVMKTESMSMGWCLDCHREPEPSIRPMDQVYNMAWQAPENQYELAQMIISKRNIVPPVYCNACHR